MGHVQLLVKDKSHRHEIVTCCWLDNYTLLRFARFVVKVTYMD